MRILITNDDGIHADGLLEINNGTMNINAVEGLEATYIKINDGTINISASDDGINAANKSDNYEIAIEINGGNITIKMGQGDTDGIDSNGNILKNTQVIFNINGVFYTRMTDGNGVARLNINLMSGEYIITSSYDGLNIANKVTIS